MFKLNLRELWINIAKKDSKSLVIPAGLATDRMALNFFPETTLLLKVDRFKGIVNRNKIDGMVNDHSSSCD